MPVSWADELGFKAFRERAGSGGTVGFLIGGALAVISKMAGWTKGALSWILMPVTAIAGLILGDAIKKDGYVFGKNGVINALKNKNKPKTIPDGHLAADPYSTVAAVNSETLARTGEVHMPFPKSPDELLFGFKELRPLDPYVEFSIKDDPRLEALKIKAKSYGSQYADKNSPDYIENTHAREKKITNLIIDDIGETYGSYSDTAANWGNWAEHRALITPRSMIMGGRTVELCETSKDSLICRHYAPIASVLLHEAGVANHVVGSHVMPAYNINGLRTTLPEAEPGGHMYVITDEGNAVVEATVAGTKYAHKTVYRPIINGVTTKDIVLKGKTAIVETQDGYGSFAYGGHAGQGVTEPNKSLTNALTTIFTGTPHVKESILKNIEEYNESVREATRTKSKEVKPDADMQKAKVQANDALEGLKTLLPEDPDIESTPTTPRPTNVAIPKKPPSKEQQSNTSSAIGG